MRRILKGLLFLNIVFTIVLTIACIYKAVGLHMVKAGNMDVPEEKMKVALTFDDGPSPECTLDLLEGLKERDVKATFFLIGQKAEENPKLVRAIHEGGHIIGNHSYSHVNLGAMSKEKACEQIDETNQVIFDETGEYPMYLRSPFGSTKKNLDCSMDMIEVLWDVDPRDWEIQNTDKIVRKVIGDVKEGDIILLHDGYDTSTAAAFQIIDILKEKGYQFVTIDELIFE